jgi:two-component sensor histidine kinase/PAS domain-containing protein
MKRKNLLFDAVGLGSKTTLTLTLCVLVFASGTSWFSLDSVFRLFTKGHTEFSLEKRYYHSGTVLFSLLQNVKQVQSRLKGTSVASNLPNIASGKLQVILTQILREEQVSFVVMLDRHNRVIAGRGRAALNRAGRTPKAAYGLPGTDKAEKAIQAIAEDPRIGAFKKPLDGIILQEADAKVGCTLQDLPILRNSSTHGYELISKQDAYCLGIQPQLLEKGIQTKPGLVLVAVEQTKDGKLIAGLLFNNFTELATYWQEEYGTNKTTIFVDRKPILTNMLKEDKSPDMGRVMDAITYNRVISGGIGADLSGVKANGLTYSEIYLPLFRDADKKSGYQVVGVLAVASGEWLNRDLEEVHSSLVINGLLTIVVVFVILMPINRLISKKEDEIQEKQFNLEISNRTKESILSSINEGIVGFDLNGSIVFSNEGAKTLLKSDSLDLLNIRAFLKSDDYKELIDSLFKNEFTTKQAIFAKTNGATFQGEYNIFRIFGHEGLIFGFNFRDISEQLELEQERKNAAVLKTKDELLCELHDGLMQNIQSALNQIRLGNMNLLSDVELTYSNLLEAEKECVGCIVEGRKLINLTKERDPMSVEEICDEVRKSLDKCPYAEIITHFEQSIKIKEVDFLVAFAVIRSAQEAIGNAVLHSKARNVCVELLISEGYIKLVVEDDGLGMDKDIIESNEGSGLRMMRRRVQRIGGKFEVETEKGKGMKISFILFTPSIIKAKGSRHEEDQRHGG